MQIKITTQLTTETASRGTLDAGIPSDHPDWERFVQARIHASRTRQLVQVADLARKLRDLAANGYELVVAEPVAAEAA